ncbi:MAG TPA: hypothetical protein VFP93_04990 [Gammaproteobacteria bacterium]|nr:hypothetical protein [Gammaproteobacteria bacterium]
MRTLNFNEQIAISGGATKAEIIIGADSIATKIGVVTGWVIGGASGFEAGGAPGSFMGIALGGILGLANAKLFAPLVSIPMACVFGE